MNRRTFLCGLTLGTLAVPLAAKAQRAAKVHRVGYLSPVSANAPGHLIFLQSLRELGYVEGENILLEERFAGGNSSRLPALAADLVRRNVDVILAASPPAVRAATAETKTIPIVIITGDDPVMSGYVPSLARPGGNVTGVTFLTVDLFAKQLDLLKQLVPGLTRVAFLQDPTMPTTDQDLTVVRTAARALDLRLQSRPGARPARLRRRVCDYDDRAGRGACHRGQPDTHPGSEATHRPGCQAPVTSNLRVQGRR